jgi:hypothetical protein
MGVAAGQTIVVDKDLKLAFAHGRAVEMRQVIDRGACRMHCRLVDQMYLAEKGRVAGGRAIEVGEITEKRHA